MPRFALTPTEQTLLGQALFLESQARNLDVTTALALVAATTMAELQTLVQARLTLMRAALQTTLDQADAANAARKAGLQSDIAAIDSALAKL